MEDIAELGLAVRSDQVALANDRLQTFTGKSKEADLAAKGLESTAALLTKAMGFLAAAFSVNELVRLASTWTDLNSRLANAVGSHDAARVAMDRLDQMARRTYSSLEQTADSYLRNAAALTALGYSTGQQMDLTESLNNALVISATKGEAAESVMNAWSKAMALGKLSGDNLNTVIMSGGRVAQALADSMGVSVLQLRKLGEEGKITGDKMFGITTQLEQLRKEADAMPATIQDAFTLLGNAILTTVGHLDEATGASSAVANAIIAIGDNIDVVIPILGAMAGIITAVLIPSLLAATAAFVAFALSPIGLIAIAIGAVAAAATYFWNEGRKASQAADDLAASMATNAKSIDLAKTASQEYREELYKQIETQATAAASALALADAETTSARARVASLQSAVTKNPFDIGASVQLPFATKDADAALDKSLALDAAYQKIEAQLSHLDGIMKTPAGPANDNSSDPKAAEKFGRSTENMEEQIKQLMLQAAAFDQTEFAAQKAEATMQLWNAAEKAGLEITPAVEQEIDLLSTQFADAQLTLEGLQEHMKDQSPWEIMGKEVQRLNELLDRGKISWDDYGSGIGKATEKMVNSYGDAATNLLDNLENLTGALGLHGKAAFEVQKDISIARAVVAGGEAVVHSYNAGAAIGGPVVGAVFAGIALAATAAQIASIASTSYSSKSLSGAASGGGTAAASSAPVATQSATIVIRGQNNSSIGMPDFESFIDGLADNLRDGGGNKLINVIRERAA